MLSSGQECKTDAALGEFAKVPRDSLTKLRSRRRKAALHQTPPPESNLPVLQPKSPSMALSEERNQADVLGSLNGAEDSQATDTGNYYLTIPFSMGYRLFNSLLD